MGCSLEKKIRERIEELNKIIGMSRPFAEVGVEELDQVLKVLGVVAQKIRDLDSWGNFVTKHEVLALLVEDSKEKGK